MNFIDRADPEIVPILDFMPAIDLSGDIPAARRAVNEAMDALLATLPTIEGVVSRDLMIAGEGDDPKLRIRIYEPEGGGHDGSALLYIHGGGMVLLRVEDTDQMCRDIVAELGCVVVSVDYRLAPEHPYPAAVHDCVAALRWLHGEAAALGVDPDRVAVGGGSAGGGLAAGLALEARDRGLPVCFQWLIYPMIDDRNETPSSHEVTEARVWNRDKNVLAWDAYLAGTERSAVPLSAAPARAGLDDLAGLPPAYIDVGEVDLFRDEDIAYAARLMQAGVACELHVTPGAFHASESYHPTAASSQRILGYRKDALRRGLAPR